MSDTSGGVYMPVPFNRDYRLPESQYFPVHQSKSGICIHHTVGGTALSTFNWWLEDPRMIGTAFIIARDGTVHEVFDPRCWAWQFGLDWSDEDKTAFERRFIGIEIASEGGLKEQDGRLYCFDRISDKTKKKREEAFDYGQVYRGYRYYDRYEAAQTDALYPLINHLCTTFGIPRETPDDHFKYYGKSLKDFQGIIGHAMVRSDKSDPAPVRSMWDTLLEKCDVRTVHPQHAPARVAPDPDTLFEHNVLEIDRMQVAAGSMVKGLIMELSRGGRDTYIRLRDAVQDGHKVYYDFIQGDPGLVFRIANALGFKTVTHDTLEVRNA